MAGLWQPDADRKTLKLSSGGARFAWFGYTMVRQTKGRWGSGYGADGLLGAPLKLEWVQLQIISEGLKTKPSQWLEVRRDDPKRWDKIGDWVTSKKFGTIGGPRVYKEWYLQTPKKTGKSTLSSAIGIYFTGYDGEPGAEVYALAAGRAQARTVFDQARVMVLKSPLLMDEFRVYRDVIEHEPSGSIFRVLSADADYNEGFNPHAVILDELHVHKTRDLYDAMTSHLHTGAREDPIAVTITNPGDDEDSICYEVYTQAKAVIEGRPDARTDLYAWVPELEQNEIYDETKWKKVMPMSWQTIETMREARRKFPEFVFLRRYLNVWTEAEMTWLPYEFWEDAAEPGIVVPRQRAIVLAADMGMTKDTTALGWAHVVDECVCGVGTEQRDPTEHYEECHFGEVIVGSRIWGIRQRHTARNPPCHELIKGDRFPIKLLRNYIEDEIQPNYQITEFVYDKWMMEQLAQELSDEGLDMVEFPQTDQRMIPASEDLWNVITRDDLLRHPADPVLTKHVMAGVVDETGRGWRINKRKTKKPTDGLVVVLMAVHRALINFREGTPSISVVG